MTTLTDALELGISFAEGFEDDESQTTVADDLAEMRDALELHNTTWTVWLTDVGGAGTTYVTAARAESMADAVEVAMTECRSEWNQEDDYPLHVLGVARGDVEIVEWNDHE